MSNQVELRLAGPKYQDCEFDVAAESRCSPLAAALACPALSADTTSAGTDDFVAAAN
jgi:hypothetical protein